MILARHFLDAGSLILAAANPKVPPLLESTLNLRDTVIKFHCQHAFYSSIRRIVVSTTLFPDLCFFRIYVTASSLSRLSLVRSAYTR